MMDANDEWEVVDDDGFIYKRRKRMALLSSPDAVTKSQEAALSEKAQPGGNEVLSRRKKMAMLLAQKEAYAAEVVDWETMLKSQEDSLASAPIFQAPPSPEQVTVQSLDDAPSNDDLQLLHLQVEAYEGFLEQLKGLRDQGESMCKKLEMQVEASKILVEQDVFKEVVKFTPRTIIHSLTSEAALALSDRDLPATSLLGQLVANDAHDGQTH